MSETPSESVLFSETGHVVIPPQRMGNESEHRANTNNERTQADDAVPAQAYPALHKVPTPRVKNPTPRSFFRKAPRLNPTLCKPIKIPTPKRSHKGKLVQVTLSNGQSRIYPSSTWAQLQGSIKGGTTTAARKTGHLWTSETASKARTKGWKKYKKMRWSGVRQGVAAFRPVKKPTPTVVATRLLIKGIKKEKPV